MSRENVETLMRAFERGPDDPEAFYAIFDRGFPTKEEALAAINSPAAGS
jgi:hypothetical protein